jgi:hypothetical protein
MRVAREAVALGVGRAQACACIWEDGPVVEAEMRALEAEMRVLEAEMRVLSCCGAAVAAVLQKQAAARNVCVLAFNALEKESRWRRGVVSCVCVQWTSGGLSLWGVVPRLRTRWCKAPTGGR